MKKKLLAVSLVGNIVLLSRMLWAHAEHEARLDEYMIAMMRADERYIWLLDQSLSAIEAPESEEARATTDLLRRIIAGGKNNIEARRRAGLGQSLGD